MSNDEGDSTARSELGTEETEEVESWLREVAQVSHVSADGDSSRRAQLPQMGSVVGEKYRIDDMIGEGGMGAVFRATHLVSDKPVALKWMLRSSSDEGARKRFTREARAAGRIDHPNVVDVYDIGEQDDSAYLVMELLHGASLRDRLRSGPLEPTEAIDTLLPAMRGVAAAHQAGVIHRDLKPDNIFLCRAPDGSRREAKVLDFGVSTVTASENTADGALTKEGTVLGTPTYMSPEQLKNARDVDHRSDVYSFGVILYETLTGRVPFKADSYSALVLTIANDKPTPLRELRPEVPRPLEKVVMRAMATNPAARHQSMQELLEALVPFASVPTGSGAYRASAADTRNSQTRVTAIVAALLAMIALWWWLHPTATDDAQPPAVEVQPTEATLAPAVKDAPSTPPPAPLPAPTAEEPSAAPEPPTATATAPPTIASPRPTEAAAPIAPAAPTAPLEAAAPPSKPVKPPAIRTAHKAAATTSKAAEPKAAPEPDPNRARSGAISLDQL